MFPLGRGAEAGRGFGALDGTRVIDLSRVLGGPFCTQALGDHGADVIKLEPPRGDETRDWGPPFHDGDSAYFIGVNRNKRALGIDLQHPQGRDTLLRMLASADVLVENFKPGTMEKWGLGYEDCLAGLFPRLVHCRISGFGDTGPWGGLPGYDAIVQAMTAWFSVNGEEGSAPTRLGLPLVDLGTGLYCAVAILMALLERERSGRGQFLDMTLYDSAVALLHPHLSNYLYSGEAPRPTGNSHPNISPYDTFRTGTVIIFIGAGNNRAFAKLCAELGKPELAREARFRDNSDRVLNRGALKGELEALLAAADGAELCERLARAGLAAGPIYDVAQVAGNAHTRHRGMVVELAADARVAAESGGSSRSESVPASAQPDGYPARIAGGSEGVPSSAQPDREPTRIAARSEGIPPSVQPNGNPARIAGGSKGVPSSAQPDREPACIAARSEGIPPSVQPDWNPARAEGLAGYRGAGIPIKFSRTPGSIRHPPPKYGEHCRDILASFGFSGAETEELIAAGAVLEARRR